MKGGFRRRKGNERRRLPGTAGVGIGGSAQPKMWNEEYDKHEIEAHLTECAEGREKIDVYQMVTFYLARCELNGESGMRDRDTLMMIWYSVLAVVTQALTLSVMWYVTFCHDQFNKICISKHHHS